jgi:hypothetical protein
MEIQHPYGAVAWRGTTAEHADAAAWLTSYLQQVAQR